MRQFIWAAAFAATLLLAPASGAGSGQKEGERAAMRPIASGAASAPATADPYGHDHAAAVGRSAAAPGQSEADFRAWLARAPAHAGELAAFRAYLAGEGLAEVVPVWQLVRTASAWRQCGAEPFEVAPRDAWPHIAVTLRFVRDRLVPALGPVEAVSAYRNEALNACSDGAPLSAHRLFFALDLAPVDAAVDRGALIHDVCTAHARHGRAYQAGLGFYSGLRFHVDSNGYRKWGPDGHSATSPCGGV